MQRRQERSAREGPQGKQSQRAAEQERLRSPGLPRKGVSGGSGAREEGFPLRCYEKNEKQLK